MGVIMGLSFSHGNMHFSYGSFMQFRSMLAEKLGYPNLRDMYNSGTYDVMINEPIYPLINHSDCDGELTVNEMKQIIPQLTEIINKLPTDSIEFDRGNCFINAMTLAIENGEPLEFC